MCHVYIVFSMPYLTLFYQGIFLKYKDASFLPIGEASKPQYCFSEKFLPLATVNVIL